MTTLRQTHLVRPKPLMHVEITYMVISQYLQTCFPHKGGPIFVAKERPLINVKKITPKGDRNIHNSRS